MLGYDVLCDGAWYDCLVLCCAVVFVCVCVSCVLRCVWFVCDVLCDVV